MERILSDNEKIRRAEEIYYRRNHRNVSIRNGEGEKQKNKTYLGSKIMLEMLILVLLAGGVFAVKNREYIFTQEFLTSVANYNVNLTEKVNWLKEYLKDGENMEEIFVDRDSEKQEEKTEEQLQETNENQESQEQQEAQESQAVTDSASLKNVYTFIKPIEGVVSSRFGARESQYQNVKGTHTGIDLASPLGTPIKAAINGTVLQVSSEGDYGNHIKIATENVITLYAHCQEIFVSEGQEIMQGQEIASVGSTGNSTGPHLHFEVRIDDVPINPEEVVVF